MADAMDALRGALEELREQRRQVQQGIRVLQGMLQPVPVLAQRKRRWTPEQRARLSVAMRAWHASRREEQARQGRRG